MMRFRRLGWVLFGFAVLIGLLCVGAWFYLASGAATSAVASRLEKVYGGSVQVEDAQVGLGGSALSNLKLYESSSQAVKPWATAAKVQTDVSVWDVLRGAAMPRHITLTGLDMILHFDRNGHLLTKLPAESSSGATTLPDIRLQGGTLRLHQEGRPPMDIHGISGELHSEKGQWVLTGTIQDPFWERWDVRGQLNRATETGSLTLTTRQVHVTMEKLRALPYVKPVVWEEVEVEGDTPVTLTVRLETQEKVHYQIAMEPKATQVYLPLIDFRAQQAQGKLSVDDGVVHLSDVTGDTAGGTLKTSGTLDYMSTPSKLDFKMSVHHVDVQQLPKKWGLPPEIEGHLDGWADLHMAVVKGEYLTSGQGKGTISDARVAGLQAEPIELSLQTEGHGFQFRTGQTARAPFSRDAQRSAVSDSRAPLRVAAKQPAAVDDDILLPIHLVNRFVAGLNEAIERAAQAGHDALKYLPAPGPPPAEKATRGNNATPPATYVTVNLKLNDIDVAQLAQRLQLKLPFRVAGRLTTQVTAGLPVNTVRDMQAYRLHGSATAPRLVLDNLEFADVNAKVSYENGLLRLEELHGAVPDPHHPQGAFAGAAQYHYIPQGDLTAQLTVTSVPLTQAAKLVPRLASPVDGVVNGNLQARIEQGKLNDFDAWHLTGNIAGAQLAAYGVRLDDVSTQLSMDHGLASISGLKGKLYQGEVTGKAVVPLQTTAAGSVQLAIKGLDMAALSRDLPSLPVRIEGRVNGTVDGTLPPSGPQQARSFTAKVALAAPHLVVQNIPADKLHGTVDYRNQQISYQLTGETLGGTFQLNGTAPTTEPAPVAPAPSQQGHLRLHGVRLGRLWEALNRGQGPSSLTGTFSLDISYRQPSIDQLPSGSGTFRIDDLGWGTLYSEDNDIEGRVLLREGVLVLENVSGWLAQGLFRASGMYDYHHPERSRVFLALDSVDAEELFVPWPGLAGKLTGLVDIRIRTALGRVWHGHGTVAMAHGRLTGAEVTDLYVPFSFRYLLRQGSGELEVRDSRVNVAHGHITGSAHAGIGPGSNLRGQLQFTDLNLRTLLLHTGIQSHVGNGRMSGHADFEGMDVHSIDDVSATVRARFRETQADQMPILSQVFPFLGLSGATTFTSGDLRGQLSRGVFRVQKLILASNLLQLYADGWVSLQGTLDLHILARSQNMGGELNGPVVRLLGLRIPATGVLPIGLVAEATNFLSNRLVRMHVSGTVRHPTMQYRPLALLTEEAIRFFLSPVNLAIP